MDKIGIKSVIVLILTSCLGIRWIPVAGSIGPSAIIYWLLGAIMFLLPLSLIIIELAANYEGNGGIQLWVENALGKKAGYYVAWMYWVNNFFFYPALVVYTVANFAYLIGNKGLADNQFFVISCVIITLWFAIFINIKGIRLVSDITSLACIANVGLGLFIIISGICYFLYNKSPAAEFKLHNFIPNISLKENLSNLTLLMFALSGIELIPTLAGSIRDSSKVIARGMLYSVIIVLFIYIAGTLAINCIISPVELNATTGLMETLEAIALKLHLPWVSKILIACLLFVELGALIVWLLAPTVMFFECVEPGVLPHWIVKENAKQIPANALMFIGIAVTLIVTLTHYLPTVNSIFTVLVLMGTIVYFIPYLFLALAYAKIKLDKRLHTNFVSNWLGITCAILMFLAIIIGIMLSFAPTSDLKTKNEIIIYELELILGPVLFIFIGYLIYTYRNKVA